MYELHIVLELYEYQHSILKATTRSFSISYTEFQRISNL